MVVYDKKWNNYRSGRVLTRSVKSLIRDLEYERLNPRECLMDGLTEIAECLINHGHSYTATNLENYETRFGELILYLSGKGFNVNPYIKLHESLFNKIREEMIETTFESDPEGNQEELGNDQDTGIPARYKLRTRADVEGLVDLQSSRVKGLFIILKKIYHECRNNLVDSRGNIINPRFREVWENFQYDLGYLEKQGQNVSEYRGSLEELFGDEPINISGINLQGVFISGAREPNLSEMVS